MLLKLGTSFERYTLAANIVEQLRTLRDMTPLNTEEPFGSEHIQRALREMNTEVRALEVQVKKDAAGVAS
jgi:hypothetical protein